MAGVVHGKDKVNRSWQQAVLAAIDSFPEHGGYYTGGKPNELFAKTTWRGLHDAYQMTTGDERPRFDPMLGTRSTKSNVRHGLT